MVVVNIMGGLGNQMFQYATARSLAARHGTEVRVDHSRFDHCRPNADHTYQLDNFAINAASATRWEAARYRTPVLRNLTKISCLLRRPYSHGVYTLPTRMYTEPPGSAFKGEILDLGPDCYLIGYFNSYKYFQEHKDLVVADFVPKTPLSNKAKEALCLIAGSNSVGVHIRRGDYITNPHVLKSVEGIITERYYRNAFTLIADTLPDPHFYLFSNDMAWVKDHMKPPGRTTYVDFNLPQQGFEDLWMMSRCKHSITAGGSTFSWWAAYLNPNANKLVIRTACISNDLAYNNPDDYFPPDWRTVPS